MKILKVGQRAFDLETLVRIMEFQWYFTAMRNGLSTELKCEWEVHDKSTEITMTNQFGSHKLTVTPTAESHHYLIQERGVPFIHNGLRAFEKVFPLISTANWVSTTTLDTWDQFQIFSYQKKKIVGFWRMNELDQEVNTLIRKLISRFDHLLTMDEELLNCPLTVNDDELWISFEFMNDNPVLEFFLLLEICLDD